MIKGSKISITEIWNESNNLKTNVQERIDYSYIPLIIGKIITGVKKQTETEKVFAETCQQNS